MKIEFSLAKDGNQTFTAEGLFYHSKYSPQKEAERFVESLSQNQDINPQLIFLIEPGLDYCSTQIRKLFSSCKIAAIRLFEHSKIIQGGWDYNISFSDTNPFTHQLVNSFGEEKILASAIYIWPAAKNVFGDLITNILTAYKNAIEESKTLLVTRQFFEKKWLINSCNFVNYAKTIVLPEIKKNLPVVICASGPSLKPCLSVIKENREKIILIGLSSATKVLLQDEIIPDFVLTTDGGYWAGQHLKSLCKYNVPLAAPAEAFIPKQLLCANKIIPLKYDDESSFISNSILEQSGFNSFEAKRNPTVSGTALFLALSFNPSKVFFCGLDLSASKGQQHTKPNELEINNSLMDNRIKSAQTRLVPSYFGSQSLEIYKNWFTNLENPKQLIVRVIDDEYKNNELGNIKDCSSRDFSIQLQDFEKVSNKIKFLEQNNTVNNKNKIQDFVLQALSTEKWQKQIFPADYISISNDEKNESLKQRLNTKVDKLINKLERLFSGE